MASLHCRLQAAKGECLRPEQAVAARQFDVALANVWKLGGGREAVVPVYPSLEMLETSFPSHGFDPSHCLSDHGY
ncbi:MAG: hypothetical protein J7493_16890 [Porphyrobacter sp.]|nr:hypothetical protein [Porphyrobacter sp.]